MKKIIVGIFAHPDDEAFGPSGTLLLETKAGTELHLITLTAGENGTNPDNEENLGEVRLREWRAAGDLIGAAGMHHLGFADGTLNNRAFLDIIKQLGAIVHTIVSSQTEPVEIEFMSLELGGISGHIDHIVAARAACYVFYSLQEQGLPMTRIRLATVPRSLLGTRNLDFVYMEEGCADEDIDEVVDARSIVNEVYAIMRAHHSQRGDCEAHISRLGDGVAMNHFMVKK